MAELERPNPDTLLAALEREDARTRRGRLKVFFGMAPGVGKTYAMLEAARRELAAGRDVVIGYIETHGRKETEALTEGLPVLPRLKFDYRGVTLTELDLDGLLARRPPLALVDELAHTNVPGARHLEVWGPHAVEQTHYLRVYIAQLREKLEAEPAKPRLIVTEPGVGYRLLAEA